MIMHTSVELPAKHHFSVYIWTVLRSIHAMKKSPRLVSCWNLDLLLWFSEKKNLYWGSSGRLLYYKVWCYFMYQFLENSSWNGLGTACLSRFSFESSLRRPSSVTLMSAIGGIGVPSRVEMSSLSSLVHVDSYCQFNIAALSFGSSWSRPCSFRGAVRLEQKWKVCIIVLE